MPKKQTPRKIKSWSFGSYSIKQAPCKSQAGWGAAVPERQEEIQRFAACVAIPASIVLRARWGKLGVESEGLWVSSHLLWLPAEAGVEK